ncbi:MAG: transcriptional regulator, partial [Hungatella hathewayi]|nr:transcriptional regulator [Hungatella hathewayi]
SYHMKILCESGIVSSRQEGKWTHYRLSAAGRDYAVDLLKKLTTPDTEQKSECICQGN